MQRLECFRSERIVDTRSTFYRCGVDFGSDAKVLLINGMTRLVWAKGTKTLIGIRGMGHAIEPCKLEMRRFSLQNDKCVLKTNRTLAQGGRLSKEMLNSLSNEINKEFGLDVANLLDIKRTLIVGQDEVGDWLKKQMILDSEKEKKRSDAFKARMNTCDTFDGLKF